MINLFSTYRSHSPTTDSCYLLILLAHFQCPLREDKLRIQTCVSSAQTLSQDYKLIPESLLCSSRCHISKTTSAHVFTMNIINLVEFPYLDDRACTIDTLQSQTTSVCYKKKKNFSKHFFQKNKDTVTVHTPHSSCVSVVGTKPLAIDRVPYVSYLQREMINELASCKQTNKQWMSELGYYEPTVSLATENNKSPSLLYLI